MHIAHKNTKSDRGVLVFSIDNMFRNGKGNLANPLLVMTESESGGVWDFTGAKGRKMTPPTKAAVPPTSLRKLVTPGVF